MQGGGSAPARGWGESPTLGIELAADGAGAELRRTSDGRVYYDPTTTSYSYALIDLKLPYGGDKRIFGWDDYPHEGVEEIEALRSYPHHFQRRQAGDWIFEESEMRGDIGTEIEAVIIEVKDYLAARTQE